ncbi:sensor histidine kinase [Yinghuangia soli]|uniref:histidine kinase n=1 Tax=Yinghuangia soli TaxID=2908204 RepID=A0AA41Q0X2_9ACTN|nr:histidine kinase [Yinghuangia soli]MCF2528012.1 histidine kinase [Yinghuangia soli]
MSGVRWGRVGRFVGSLRRTGAEWAIDGLLTLGAVAVGVTLLVGSMDEDPSVGDHITAQIFYGVVAAVAFLVFRRRFPVTLAWICVLAGFTFVTVMGTTVVALFGVAERRRPRTSVSITAVHALLVFVLFYLATEDRAEYFGAAGVFLFFDVVALTGGLLVRSQRMLVGSLQERARQAENEQRMLVEEARLLERERIAREMHDVLAHRISLLAVHAGALEVRSDASPQEARAAGVIRQAAHDALEDLRDVIRMLRTDEDAGAADRPQPTLGDLPALIEQSRRAGAVVEFACAPVAPETSARVGRHAYRIVQEGLTNARKHAPGARVRVDVAAAEQAEQAGLAIEIVNPLHVSPASVPALPGAGAGLIGLRERVTLVGGRLEHGTEDGEFRLRAWLPWQPSAETGRVRGG